MSISQIYEYIQGEFQDITRQILQPSGAGDVWFVDPLGVKIAGYNIELWDAATGGTMLVEGSDYSLVFLDTGKTAIEGFNIWAGYNVITPAYQGVNLYLNMRVIGGYTKYQEVDSGLPTMIVKDTTAGDYDASGDFPAGAADGTTVIFSNIGTGGNHIIGLPNSITLGDDKTVSFILASSIWYYEDVIIDEYYSGVTNADTHVNKWSGGRMLMSVLLDSGANDQTWTFPETFTSPPIITMGKAVLNSRFAVYTPPTTTATNTRVYTDIGNATGDNRSVMADGRWKTGA